MSANPAINPSEMFKAFLDAGNALEELPKVRQAQADAEELAKSYANDLDAERSSADSLRARIAELEASLSAREAALADATFRNSQLSQVVDIIRGALPVHTPESEPIQHPITEPVAEVDPHVPAAERNYCSVAPATEAPAIPFGSLAAGPTESSGGCDPSGGDLIMIPGPATTNDWTDPDITAQTPKEPEINIKPVAADPYPAWRPYWQKPSTLSWADWSATGGEVPSWVSDLTAA